MGNQLYTINLISTFVIRQAGCNEQNYKKIWHV
jgi:hypothetical protein